MRSRMLSGKKLKSAILKYRTVASEETFVNAKTSWLTDIQPESEEESIDCPDCYDDGGARGIFAEATNIKPESEESINCPDCFDAMIRFYDWDTLLYRCENCDLILNGFVKDEA